MAAAVACASSAAAGTKRSTRVDVFCRCTSVRIAYTWAGGHEKGAWQVRNAVGILNVTQQA
jgi:hypothetical protein